MTTCMYCNTQIPDGLKFCTNCGAALPVEAPVEVQAEVLPQQPHATAAPQQPDQQGYWQSDFQQPGYQQPGYQQPYAQQQPAASDSGSIGWGVLGFFFPIVGLILFLVWRTSKPNCAKVAGIGAIIGFCLGLIFRYGAFMG